MDLDFIEVRDARDTSTRPTRATVIGLDVRSAAPPNWGRLSSRNRFKSNAGSGSCYFVEITFLDFRYLGT